MNANISVFVIYAEAIIYLLLYNLHDCTFNRKQINICAGVRNYYPLSVQQQNPKFPSLSAYFP